jgi:hypothetical protein
MENLYFFLIILIVMVAIYFIHTSSENSKNIIQEEEEEKEQFENSDITCTQQDILSLNPYHRCKVLGVNKFMIRDMRTNLWLTDGLEEGFSKFLPGRFGVPLVMSEKPDEYLPLRTVADPNDHLLATYNGQGIRIVSNPYNTSFILQIFIYNGYNVIGYVNDGKEQLYLIIDDNGNITSTPKPLEASIVQIVEI